MYVADNPIKKSKEVIVMNIRAVFTPGGGKGHVTGRDSWGIQDATSILFLGLVAGCMSVYFAIIC